MTLKFERLVGSCGDCPNKRYYSAGNYECRLVNEIIPDISIISSFCPLPDFPSGKIADLERTIRILREPNTYELVLTTLSHLATKLGVVLHPRGITIPLKDGEKVYMSSGGITHIEVSHPSSPWAVHFIVGERKFRIYPDTIPPLLHEYLTVEGQDKPLWTPRQLA